MITIIIIEFPVDTGMNRYKDKFSIQDNNVPRSHGENSH